MKIMPKVFTLHVSPPKPKMKTCSPDAPKRPFSILCLAAVVLLAPFGTIDAQSRASDHLIVPGQRIGPVFIGMTETQLHQKLGDPSATTRGKDDTWIDYDYNNLGLSITTNPAIHKVDMIRTRGEEEASRYSTREGIRVGSSELQIQILPWKLLWKSPGQAGLWKFQYPGIQIETQNGNVILIKIQSPN